MVAIFLGFVFGVMGIGFIVAGATVSPTSLTDDGLPLDSFLNWSGATTLLSAAACLFEARSSFRQSANLREIMNNGPQGRAIISSISDTGLIVNEGPRVRLHLVVSMENRATFERTLTVNVPLAYVGRLTPGASVAVRANPKDSRELYIAWGKS